LLADTDFVRTRRTTDIVVQGHAHAPGGRHVSSLDVGFSVGDVHKQLRVQGDRVFQRQLTRVVASEPQPFVRMPLTYERAYGGRDLTQGTWLTDNPIGVGFAADASRLIGQSAPNIEALSDRPGEWRTPMGVLPIPSQWTPRARYAGTYDAAWQTNKAPLLPDDLDDRFYQSAPADQQSKQFLRGGEAVRLHNLSPQNELRFELPRIALGFETKFRSDAKVHVARLHQVILETDEPRVTLVFHTALRCHGKVDHLRTTTITQKKFLQAGGDA
jgi:hypothetical protein